MTFHKLLIANRGEIALRILRTARRMGYGTVAVYSTADAGAPHVTEADQAVCIGEALPPQSYLNIAAVVEAARQTGADAVHPGYGFLAENDGFAQACRDAGLVFVGPSPEAIRAMGDKAGAKRRLAEAGVPVIPGYEGADQSAQRLQQEADGLGYPVMIKATAGGGGRGMRLVRESAEFAALLQSAQSEAANAFGDATVLLERAVSEPRHVEIQVFADRHGNALHLGERDCSVQRRHQKLVEESPSPAVDEALRERMGTAAVAAVKAIGYEGAGTLEFLLDRDGQFFFMEMNTRLQVEHPVTEALTGLDLVEWQLRVATGEPLPLRQADVRSEGHAIEVRLCAEDPAKDFLPQSGVMREWRAPAGLRVDHALRSGAEVPPWYDSMVAKLVAHGRTRDEARRKLVQGLHELVALGVTTNQAFLARCLQHDEFAAGGATTAFIARHRGELLAHPEDRRVRARAVAGWLLRAREGQPHPLAPALTVALRLELDGERLQVHATPSREGAVSLLIGEQAHTLVPLHVGPRDAQFVLDGIEESVAFVRQGNDLWLHLAGQPHHAVDRTLAATARSGAAGDGKVRASMNGRVVTVLVKAGDRVEAGQPLLTLEAMKMEHVHAAGRAGVVQSVAAGAGEQVSAGRVLVEIAPA